MDIPDTHRELLLLLGVKAEELERFDGKNLTYEYNHQKGVRLYDPFSKTSCTRYVAVDGWTSWSSEEDRFLEQLFPQGLPQRADERDTKLTPEEAERMRKRFRSTR